MRNLFYNGVFVACVQTPVYSLVVSDSFVVSTLDVIVSWLWIKHSAVTEVKCRARHALPSVRPFVGLTASQ